MKAGITLATPSLATAWVLWNVFHWRGALILFLGCPLGLAIAGVGILITIWTL